MRVLWLNADDLTVRKAEARVEGKTVAGRVYAQPKDYLGIGFDPQLPTGTATVRIEYSGRLSRRDTGGVLKTQEGGEWYVTTHFEPIDARRAYPCFDEPSYKVPWELTLRVNKEHAAFANTPVVSREDGADGMSTVRFAPTRPLPSYLTAFAAGPFERLDAGKTGKNETPVGVIVPRGAGDSRALRRAHLAASRPASRGLLRLAVSVRKARQRRRPARARRDGERRPRHLRLPDPPRPSGRGDADLPPLADQRHDARVRPHVVRRLGDHGLVGRHLAQRGLRHLDDVQGPRALVPAVEDRGVAGLDPQRRHGRGRPRHRAPDPPADRVERRHGECLRRHHLPEGRFGHLHVRAPGVSGKVPARRAQVHEGPRLLERHGQGLPLRRFRRGGDG